MRWENNLSAVQPVSESALEGQHYKKKLFESFAQLTEWLLSDLAYCIDIAL